MAGTMVSASTGAMNSLLGKLATLMGDEYDKLKGVRKEVASLDAEFSSMRALLEKLADTDGLDALAKEWRSQVKDMSYDIEDCIDHFMHHLGKNDTTTGFMKKTARLLKKLRVRHQIASKIQEIKARVKEVDERRRRYNLDAYTLQPTTVFVDPRAVAIYTEAANLVGIDGPREQIIKLMMSEEQKLKVASIVGFGGLGKTTLANQVYCKLEGLFECRAFVSVSQKPDIPKLLSKILLEIGGFSSNTSELKDLLKNITEKLKDKRYFMVIDDLWDISTWEIIKCAFPENNRGSRVLTTTRVRSVANACCSYSKQYVHYMRPLGEEDSKRLFFSRVFRSGEDYPDAFEELSVDILKKCGGLPLAIISISSLLAGQSNRTWEYVRDSLGSMFKGNPNLEDMKQILDLSYKHLPHHLKTCLLYVGMYPEDHIIKKDDLLRQWIAEGFVSKFRGLDAEDVAESYFNELVNMSTIQPVDMDYNDEVLSCRVHDLMLDLIRGKSEQENFIDVLDDLQATSGLQTMIRRVSLQFDDAGSGVISTTINGSVSQIRSVMAFTRFFIPSFLGFKYVRVLFLEFLCIPRHDLSGICGLFLLRYLKIAGEGLLELPNQLWNLQYLETMVLQAGPFYPLSSDIVRLRRLRHLIVPSATVFEFRISMLKSLRTLQKFDLSLSSLDSIKSLGDLTNLRDLQLCCHKSPVEDEAMDALCSSLERIMHSRNLKSLVIDTSFRESLDVDYFSAVSPSLRSLRRLHLGTLEFPSFPKWIAQLRDLYSLQLSVTAVLPKDDDIGILAGLPSLVHLHLDIAQPPEERIVIPGTVGTFPSLKHLEFQCLIPFLAFEAGVMPRLQRFDLWLEGQGWVEGSDKWVLVGIEHLPAGLREIYLRYDYDDCHSSTIAAAGSALRSSLDAYHPSVDLIIAKATIKQRASNL